MALLEGIGGAGSWSEKSVYALFPERMDIERGLVS